MPSHKTHELFGVLFWIIWLIYLMMNYSFKTERLIFLAIVGFFFCFVGASLPDVDQKKSRAFKRLRFMVAIVTFVITFVMLVPGINQKEIMSILYILTISVLVTIAVVVLLHALIPKHRGPIHSFKTGVVYAVIVLVLGYILIQNIELSLILTLFAFMSFASHLVLDKI